MSREWRRGRFTDESFVVHERLSRLEFPSGLNKRALKRYGSGYPETGKCVAGHRVPGDMVRGQGELCREFTRGETMINASTTRPDFYLHALPAGDNSLLYDYLTSHTCGKVTCVCACLDPRQLFNDTTVLNYRPTVFSTCDPRDPKQIAFFDLQIFQIIQIYCYYKLFNTVNCRGETEIEIVDDKLFV